jgi:hypothetical protein
MKMLTGKRHLVWNDKKEIELDYYQEDGMAKTYYDDKKQDSFSADSKKEIDDKKVEKGLKEKPNLIETDIEVKK